MAKCPKCKKDLAKPKKTWKYGQFSVQAYLCDCGTQFRDYAKSGKHSFTLALQKGKGYVKARCNTEIQEKFTKGNPTTIYHSAMQNLSRYAKK